MKDVIISKLARFWKKFFECRRHLVFNHAHFRYKCVFLQVQLFFKQVCSSILCLCMCLCLLNKLENFNILRCREDVRPLQADKTARQQFKGMDCFHRKHFHRKLKNIKCLIAAHGSSRKFT